MDTTTTRLTPTERVKHAEELVDELLVNNIELGDARRAEALADAVDALATLRLFAGDELHAKPIDLAAEIRQGAATELLDACDELPPGMLLEALEGDRFTRLRTALVELANVNGR